MAIDLSPRGSLGLRMGFFARLRFAKSRERGKSGLADARAYAIGDIHGRRDLLDILLKAVEHDLAERPTPKAFIVFLGDLIDRGPESAGVIELLRTYSWGDLRPIFLCGNHEEVFLRVLQGEPDLHMAWLKYGGAECVQSYGADPDQLVGMDSKAAAAVLARHVPARHIAFLKSFGDTFTFGDYVFVHAGIRPGIPLMEQSQRDLRWIREAFLEDGTEHGVIVVHGHTVTSSVDERRNRIGIDTGAVRSGKLTALVVDGEDRRYLSTKD